MSLIDEDCINAHIVEVLYIVGLAVKHFASLYLGILTSDVLTLAVTLLTLCGSGLADCAQLVLQLFDFLLCLTDNCASAAFIGFTHLLQYSNLLVNLVLYETHLTLLTVWNTLEYRLRNDNHIPVVVFNLCIEVLSAFLIAIFILQCQHLRIRVKFLGTGYKLTYGCVLNNNHRFLRCTKSAHFHCCTDEGEGLTCADLMSKQQRLHGTSHDSLGLVLTHLELVVCTAKVFWHEVHAYIYRNIVVELLVVGFLDAC